MDLEVSEIPISAIEREVQKIEVTEVKLKKKTSRTRWMGKNVRPAQNVPVASSVPHEFVFGSSWYIDKL